MDKKIRVLIAKPGLDGHDQGAKVVALALKDAGFEVIYTGLHQSAESIAEAALQEDVDIVGLSVLSGAHVPLTDKVRREMDSRKIGDKPIVVGGNIPERDFNALTALGVKAVFPTGARFDDIIGKLKGIAG